MVSYSSIYPLSEGAGGGDPIPLSGDATLSHGGIYLVISNASLECASLPVGAELAINNGGNYNIVAHGFNTVNASAIATNKGLKLPSNGGIWINKNGADSVVVRAGNYTVDWIPGFAPTGYKYWRFSYNGTLSELQYKIGDTYFLFSSANNCILSISASEYSAPNLAAISNNTLNSSSEYIGNASETFCTITAEFAEVVQIQALGVAPQNNGTSAFNIPGKMRISASTDGIAYSEPVDVNVSPSGTFVPTSTLTAQGFTSGQLKQINFSL